MPRFTTCLAALLAASAAAPAAAQMSEAEFQYQVLERLERIEQRLGIVATTAGGAGGDGVTAATNEYCGDQFASCRAAATAYCAGAGYARGLPADIQIRAAQAFMTRVTCTDRFN